jgi:hypothetical protein
MSGDATLGYNHANNKCQALSVGKTTSIISATQYSEPKPQLRIITEFSILIAGILHSGALIFHTNAMRESSAGFHAKESFWRLFLSTFTIASSHH